MPNYCDYIMKVVGKRNDCRTFMTKLKSYDVADHFWRIFEADAQEEKKRRKIFFIHIRILRVVA